mmetsp:Transcript_44021/g.106748  ORF Transcript_44021/g.106748 Transcript_44021/m.106748 type:complete len:427 (+) Transcript_44021:249-1529(+)
MSSFQGNINQNDFCKCSGYNVIIPRRSLQEYQELPMKEQQQVWLDLSGKNDNTATARRQQEFLRRQETDPSLLEKHLEYVEQALEHLIRKDREKQDSNNDDSTTNTNTASHVDALRTVMNEHPEYVHDRKFLVKFLRAEKYDATKVASRIAAYFDEKQNLFGRDKLTKEIELSDLDEHDMESLRLGFLQVLAEPDHANRKVLFYYKALTNCYKERENILKTFWYLTNVLSRDEDVQRFGIVNVVYNNGGFPENGMDYEKSRRLARLFKAIPVRFSSFLVCIDEGPWLTVVDTFSIIVDKFIRIRLRAILGSRQECFYQLMTLGIPVYTMPVNERNQVLVGVHLLWIEDQRRTEMLAREQRWLERQQRQQQQQQQQQHLQDETSSQALIARGSSSYEREIMQPNAMMDLLQATSSHYFGGDYQGAVG